MLEWFIPKYMRRKKEIYKCMCEAYDPLFSFRTRLITELIWLAQFVQSLENLQADLNKVEDKDEEQIIRERWQALQFDPILEHYRLTLVKINEVLENTPDKPQEKPTYEFDFYGSNHDG
jgi:hypothetical protein